MRVNGVPRGGFVRALWLGLAVVGAAAGCGDDDGGHHDDGAAQMLCGPAGESVACTGPGGCSGAQVCGAEGSYDACDCEGGPAAGCSPAGVVMRCVDEDGCEGQQVCDADGSFGACECSQAGADGVTELTIESPEPGDVVEGTLEVKGSAEGAVARVAVSIDGGPLLAAEGTESWSFRYDVSDVEDRLIVVRVLAIGDDGGQLERWLQVRVSNADPLVGSWATTESYNCTITFRASGAFAATEGCYQSVVSTQAAIWRHEEGNVIVLDQREFAAILSDDDDTLELTNRAGRHERFTRVGASPDADAGSD